MLCDMNFRIISLIEVKVKSPYDPSYRLEVGKFFNANVADGRMTRIFLKIRVIRPHILPFISPMLEPDKLR